MNMNATAQMVTTTQRGCETDRDLQRKLNAAIDVLLLLRYDGNGHITAWPTQKEFETAFARIAGYPLPTGRTK